MQEIIETLQKIVNSKEQITLAILYGSFANGKATSKSDIDIAVAGTNPFSSETLAESLTWKSPKKREEKLTEEVFRKWMM